MTKFKRNAFLIIVSNCSNTRLRALRNSSNTRLRTSPAFPGPRAFEKTRLFNARGLGNAGKVQSRVFERTSESHFPKY